jgi:hypothetical protein
VARRWIRRVLNEPLRCKREEHRALNQTMQSRQAATSEARIVTIEDETLLLRFLMPPL